MNNDFTRHGLIKNLGIIRDQHPDLLAIAVEMARKVVSDTIRTRLSNQVAYGVFKGLRLSAKSHWSGSDAGVMLLGLYEQEILNAVASVAQPHKIFVNLGAADGYYGIGVIVAGLFSHAYCYESNEASRNLIHETAYINHVSDKITIRGTAEKGFYHQIPFEQSKNMTVLIDIEGGELDILDRDLFKDLPSSDIIVELHPWAPNFESKMRDIIISSQETHELIEITTGNRDLSSIAEVQGFHDSYRWLLCSEGRPMQMSWLHFKPIITA